MARISDVLNLARRALNVQRTAMNITGHNIANANTEGYTRQRVTMSSTIPLRTTDGMLGTGVQVVDIRRIRDTYLDAQILSENLGMGRWEYRERVYGEMEAVFAEPSDHALSAVLTQFWDSWQDLSNNPESAAVRQVVKQRANTLATTLNDVHSKLVTIQKNLNQEVGSIVKQINEMGEKIADLNRKIALTETTGKNANDYRDQRDLLLQKLGRLVDFQQVEMDNGMINVTIGGEMFVGLTETRHIEFGSKSLGDISVDVPKWESTENELRIVEGRLGAVLEMRDEVVPQYQDRLDTLALALVQEVNALHRDGYSLSGSTNILFFDEETTGAADIDLSAEVKADVNMIAASSDGSPGNGDIALDLAQLKDVAVLDNDQSSITDYYNSLINVLGLESEEAISMRENQELFLEQLEQKLESISGVSLDEEMTNMMQQQRAFQAAAQLVNTVDEMFVTLLDMV